MRSQHRNRALTAFALAAALEIVACPAAVAGTPTDRLREFFAKVNDVLHDPATEHRPLERVVRVRRLVADIGDVDAAAATALGPGWDTKTAAERDEFVKLFADLLERAYVARLAGAARAGGGLTMAYGNEVVVGNEATVSTTVRSRGGHDLRVDFRMGLRGGRWRVRDLVVDGVSTVDSYRVQFKRLLQQGSHVSLVSHMREKLTAESLMFARSEPGSAPAIAAAGTAEPSSTRGVVERPRRSAAAPAAAASTRGDRVARLDKGAIPAPPPPTAAPVSSAVVASTTDPVDKRATAQIVLGAVLLAMLGVGAADVRRRRSMKKRQRQELS